MGVDLPPADRRGSHPGGQGGGYEQMSIRSLADELGVAPMSLYRHVRDKDDLLDEVVDRLLAKAWRPSADRPTGKPG